MDNERDFKRIEDKYDEDEVQENFLKSWEERYKPETRHILKAREIINEEGGLVTHKRMLYLLKKEFGYREGILNKMLDIMIEKDVFQQEFFESEFDLRYYILEE